jgi:hypothetical protein
LDLRSDDLGGFSQNIENKDFAGKILGNKELLQNSELASGISQRSIEGLACACFHYACSVFSVKVIRHKHECGRLWKTLDGEPGVASVGGSACGTIEAAAIPGRRIGCPLRLAE